MLPRQMCTRRAGAPALCSLRPTLGRRVRAERTELRLSATSVSLPRSKIGKAAAAGVYCNAIKILAGGATRPPAAAPLPLCSSAEPLHRQKNLLEIIGAGSEGKRVDARLGRGDVVG